MKMANLSRLLTRTAGGVALLVFFYWGKCQLNIDLIPNFAWETAFPVLDALQYREPVVRPGKGVVFATDFNEWQPGRHWMKLWSADKDLAGNDFVACPPPDAGRTCLLVRSCSPRNWSMSHGATYRVTPGDVFEIAATARTTGQATGAAVLVVYDADHRVLSWGLGAGNIHDPGNRAYTSHVVIPPKAVTARFQLTGAGRGDIFFQQVRLEKR